MENNLIKTKIDVELMNKESKIFDNVSSYYVDYEDKLVIIQCRISGTKKTIISLDNVMYYSINEYTDELI